MLIFKKSIPRRTFLRGAGAAIALPFLDAMIPAYASASAAKQPLRLGYVYLPVGRIMDSWIPKTEGADYELSPTLQPFAPFRDKMLVLSGLDIKAAHLLPGERGGPHARPCAAYLTGVHPFDAKVGISVDQVIANETSKNTQFGSLELGLDPPEWGIAGEADYPGYFRATMSWRTDTTPLPVLHNPRKVFERLFGDTDKLDSEVVQRRIKRQSSVLDSLSGRINKLMESVASPDRHKLEEYFDAVREIERGVQVTETRLADDNSMKQIDATRPAGIPASYDEHAKLMFDMLLLAYQTNMTQVSTFMMGHEATNRNFLELGAQDGHHSMSHHKGHASSIELLKKVDYYQNDLIAYFLKKMQSTPDGEGSLLDNSMIVVGSALSDGNYHLHTDVPTVVIGGAQGKLKGGRHIRYKSEPFSNLHLAAMDMFGVSSEEFLSSETSDATGILKGILS